MEDRLESEVTTAPIYRRKSPIATRDYKAKEPLQLEKARSPNDSHSYRRGDTTFSLRQKSINVNEQQTTQLRDESRRRSLSFRA
ncbi:hypothetical protein Bca4012_031305 [Brassica carinata]|uniref:(rape) hypothetical protein n=1 Tax=Brassica napus TaxID=3708 RepID=A0A816JHR0_BRANA|nr:unnamed protein product [Brassica napus]